MGEQQRHRLRPAASCVHHVHRLTVELHAQVRQLVEAVLQRAEVEGAPVIQQVIQPGSRHSLLPGVKTHQRNAHIRQPLTQYKQAILIEHHPPADHLHSTRLISLASHLPQGAERVPRCGRSRRSGSG